MYLNLRINVKVEMGSGKVILLLLSVDCPYGQHFGCMYVQGAHAFMKIHLRTDTGGLASICIFLNYNGTIVARILYYT